VTLQCVDNWSKWIAPCGIWRRDRI